MPHLASVYGQRCARLQGILDQGRSHFGRLPHTHHSNATPNQAFHEVVHCRIGVCRGQQWLPVWQTSCTYDLHKCQQCFRFTSPWRALPQGEGTRQGLPNGHSLAFVECLLFQGCVGTRHPLGVAVLTRFCQYVLSMCFDCFLYPATCATYRVHGGGVVASSRVLGKQ